MAADQTRRRLFSGLEPVPVSEVNAVVDDYSIKDRVDGPSDAVNSSSGGNRKIRGEPLGLSHIELIEATACHAWLWEYAETLQQELDEMPKRGRPREHTVFEALLFEVASGLRGNYRDLARTFDDPKTWKRLQATVAQAWPHHPRRRLSDKPINRSQFHRFRERYLHDEIIDELGQFLDDTSVNAASHVGLLNAQAGSINHPDTTQTAMGDATWKKSMYIHGPKKIINKKTGKVKRFDSGAVAYHTSSGIAARGAHGRQLVLAIVRNPHRAERIILKAAFKPPDKSDATVFTDMILDMHRRYRYVRKGLRSVIYDMALHGENIDRFLDTGIIPLSKVQRTKGDKPAAVNWSCPVFVDGFRFEGLGGGWCGPFVVGG